MSSANLLELLKHRPVIGDGGYITALERRGYAKAGPWTPEAVLEHPDAVKQLHLDFIRAGADVIQTFTYATNQGKLLLGKGTKEYVTADLNQKACDIAKEVIKGKDLILCGGVSPTYNYYLNPGNNKVKIQEEFRDMAAVLVKNGVNFLYAEFFKFIEEAEWAIEVLNEFDLPVACTMGIGPVGDYVGVTPGECAVRMAKAGADLVGVNCNFDAFTELEVLREMKTALDAADLHPYLMMQPLVFLCPDVVDTKYGYLTLPEFPFALEPRLMTRWDVRRYVREGYELGVRYFGGCCGFEPYHIRAIAEELAPERGFRMPGKNKSEPWGMGNDESQFPFIQKRVGKEYWSNLIPTYGRPHAKALRSGPGEQKI